MLCRNFVQIHAVPMIGGKIFTDKRYKLNITRSSRWGSDARLISYGSSDTGKISSIFCLWCYVTLQWASIMAEGVWGPSGLDYGSLGHRKDHLNIFVFWCYAQLQWPSIMADDVWGPSGLDYKERFKQKQHSIYRAAFMLKCVLCSGRIKYSHHSSLVLLVYI